LHISITRPEDSYNKEVLSDPTPPNSPPSKWTGDLENNYLSWHPRSPPASQGDVPRHRITTTIAKHITPPAPLTKQGIVISKNVTQNAHGLHHRPRGSDGKPLPHDPHDYTRYKHLNATMKLKQLDVYFVQETWLEGNVFDELSMAIMFFITMARKVNTTSAGLPSSCHPDIMTDGKPPEPTHPS
jgi:hypothetical protein